MKTVGFKKFGDPEVLEVMEFPDNEIGSEDIKIKNYDGVLKNIKNEQNLLFIFCQ